MKISYKNQSIERKNSEICVVTEYPRMDKDLDFAIVNISGRYPTYQNAVNKQCKEIVYIQNGTGIVVVNNIEYLLNAGDVVLIEAGEKFYWEGNMRLFISCNPPFEVDQHQLID
ncbi:cupin domain-containing protein [Legionella israelensis]|uniref:AraC family ligand binding domain-containing protein n=1 Tax=Legionella israelensis TaxID=454 RepID=UPI001180B379|nr:AraC family ligand binding domain-containing protein [Legionella israelensis]QDP71557.1 cupin domain-containing protein [Legionella israelensis]